MTYQRVSTQLHAIEAVCIVARRMPLENIGRGLTLTFLWDFQVPATAKEEDRRTSSGSLLFGDIFLFAILSDLFAFCEENKRLVRS